MADLDLITVEVAFALPQKQKIIELLVEPGTTAYQAAERSGISREFPEIDLDSAKMGIFGQALGIKGLKPPREHILHNGDRVEIYRPLTADPKEVRRRRAEKAKAQDKADK
ncbi:RnfH family protein [Gilvimarinus agarilyticus]|uniref:RnfH family protein n=1 Tax=unclassified Gilvimarinus TaxID=2642066 RepID=UPI001C095A3F|nr:MULTISPECIES: RnfH family protein [unclassified Gilvimarinus]MBU2884481.1 RnfH family protein [Gilvimarinus agarilyticus]MDO6569617.1 RnfH family protein [Gilvimarinus sp. 2_MG-2023]MDO6748576.1 RnfH family protein [Gilvimarinus sp. 1_MG-2023]